MTLGQRIQELRKGHNLSQEALGEKLGVSRQAISRWEMDGAVPEVDKLIAMGKLFGVSLNDLLQVEGPPQQPDGAAPLKKLRRWLAAVTALCLLLTVGLGILWGRTQQLNGQLVALVAAEERVYTNKPLFQTAQCRLSDLQMGFQEAHGAQTLEIHLTLEPVDALKGWEFVGLTAAVTGHDPWGAPGPERDWTEELTLDVKRTGLFWGPYEATLTLPEYGGEEVTIGAHFREKDTGLTADVEELFRVLCTKSREGLHTIESIQVMEGRRAVAVPRTLELKLPDPRFS